MYIYFKDNELNYLIILSNFKVGGKELVCGFAIINHHRKNRDEFPFEVGIFYNRVGVKREAMRNVISK